MIEQEHIKEFSVISCGKDDIEVSCEDERVQVVVKNCTVVNAQVSKMIGQPMPCNLYKNNVLLFYNKKELSKPKRQQRNRHNTKTLHNQRDSKQHTTKKCPSEGKSNKTTR